MLIRAVQILSINAYKHLICYLSKTAESFKISTLLSRNVNLNGFDATMN